MTFDVIRHYDKLVEDDNDPFRDPPPLKAYMDKWDGIAFLEALSLDKDDSVLEIGIGTGRLAAKTAPLCKELVGIDVSPKTIERAAENLSSYSNVQLVCADFIHHVFDRRFEVVYSSLTFMHFEDKQAAVSRAAELLNDGGCFVLSIDKNKSDHIDMGSYKVGIFPDAPDKITKCAEIAGLSLSLMRETEFAYIMMYKKEH